MQKANASAIHKRGITAPGLGHEPRGQKVETFPRGIDTPELIGATMNFI